MSNETRIGVDIGGTFTDVVTIRDGTVSVTKTPSTPANPEHGVIDGLEVVAADTAISFRDVTFLAHGTTVATNAVLERTWADTALVTTEGFRDALEIGRQNRPDLYDFDADKPTPIIERDQRYSVPERLDERGRVETPLDESAVRAIASELGEVDSVAISLLFSFENNTHERRIAEILEQEIDASISLSSTVLPEIREFERTLVTALNAALKPIMDNYVGKLERHMAELGIPTDLKIMQSNGGIISADVARTRPVRTLLSGPAAGVQGAAYVAELSGLPDVITMDMGGTSCDVSLVQQGDPVTSTEVTVGDYPISVPMIDVHTIGAGGGSIGWLDPGGALRVGPQSAGADPGPICYGRGGTRPTVTDAHYLLGRIDPAAFGYDFTVDQDAVRTAMAEIGETLGKDITQTAQGLLDVANANMERALRVVSVERGHDPRAFGLVAFGGAGPLHACKLAGELDIPQVLIPRTAGVLSALGLLISDAVYDFSTSRVRPWDEIDPANLESAFADFERTGADRLAGEATAFRDQVFERAVDLRYAGQSFDLTVPISNEIDETALETVARHFHERHEERYGHASPNEPLELVTVRLRAKGVVDDPDLDTVTQTGNVDDAVRSERSVHFGGDTHDTRVYDRAGLPPDGEFDGPAIIEGAESTIVVPPDQHVRIDRFRNVIVDTGANG